MKLSTAEEKLLKGALKKDTFSMKIIVLASKILLIASSIIFMYLYIKTKQDVAFAYTLLFVFVVLFISTIRNYQSLIRKIKENK